ncbi:MAG: hypothetical protein L0K86_29720, partial [Actinomycetia bacterium]|nr:hypothetical protein [Actinomycetes bacterium]
AGRTFRFARVMAPLLQRLAGEREVTVADLRASAGLDEQTFHSAVELLVRNHLAVIRSAAVGPAQGSTR